MLDMDRIRADCPACEKLTHFNNAGSSLSPAIVTNTVLAHLQLEQETGGYEAADRAATATRSIYDSIARLLNCQTGDIALVENATRGWQLASQAINFQAGDEVITFDMEYSSNYMGLLHLARQRGIQIRTIGRDEQGQIALGELEQAVTDKTRAVFLTHVASHCGDIQAAAAVGSFARKNNLFYVLDACQSVGQIDIDVAAIQCDFLCASGRKFLRGPRGTGFLYINRERCAGLEPPFVDLHSADWIDTQHYCFHEDGRAWEIWEQNVAANLGLGAAVDYALNLGIEEIQQRVSLLANSLHQGLKAINGITVQERSQYLSGIVTFSKAGEEADALMRRLRQAGVNTSVSRQIHARLDLDDHGIGDVLRASLHYFNNQAEIDNFLELVQSEN